MDFKYYFIAHAKSHPRLMPQDLAKLCYQAALGAEHLLADLSAARRYFDAELDLVSPREGKIIEPLSDEICRVDLGVWKARGLTSDALFEAFVESAKPREGGRELLAELLGQIEDLIAEVEVGFSALEWRDFLEKYIELGMPAVHHSEQYREEYKPSYRVLERELAERLLK